MATITFSDQAPSGESVTFAFANTEFTLSASGKYDTEDKAVLNGAVVHPWLKVEFDAPAADAVVEPDLSDPQVNPAVDHLAAAASQEAVEAAAAAEAAQQAANDEQAANVTVASADSAPTPVTPSPTPTPPSAPASSGVTVTEVS